MSRMSRKESHAQTRERLIATAHRLFLTDGYNATSLTAVADEAGFTKGAVYSNFATKHELGLAVVDLLHEERATSLAESMAAADSVAGVLAAFERWAEQHIGDVGWTAMEVELATSTRMIPGVGQELAARRRELTSMLGAMLEHRLPVPPEDAAVQLLAMGIGLGVQRAFDPELPITALVDLLRSLLERATPV